MVAPALIAALALLLALLLFRPPGWVLVLFLLLLFLPGRWWHWKTRRFRRGLRLLRSGDAGGARSEFEAFLFQVARESNFRRIQPYFNLGRSYPYEVAAQSNLGVCDLTQGKPEKALERFRVALTQMPEWVPAKYGSAVALKLLGEPAAAERSAREALELRPSYLAARLLLGSLLQDLGREAEAEDVLAPLIEEGRDPEALLQALEDQWGIGEM
ncbi:MAG: tetratricopeptide repeat protein [Gemmatimonadetes bacterium]|nr:tetratricopeptide repeat protein [Gemmatimonadota bacterium]